MSDTLQQDADRLEAQVRADLPPSSTWTMPPRGYRQALALCVVDGVSRQLVGPDADALIASVRAELGADAESAPVDALVSLLGSDVEVPQFVDNAISDASGALQVHRGLVAATRVLLDAQVKQTTDLVAALKDQGLDGAIGQAWIGSDVLTRRMWTDTAMLAGYLDPNVDRMIAAYTSRAMGTDPATTPPERVIAALTEVAKRFDVHILPLEFAILEHERTD